MSLDPTQPPSRNVSLTLAQAALQRQTQLLEALASPDQGSASSKLQLSEPARAQLAQTEAAARPDTAQAPPTKIAPVLPLPWPATSTDEPTLALLDTVLQAAPARGLAGAKVLAVQPWTAALVQQLMNSALDTVSGAEPSAWQTWTLPASILQTAAGRQTLQASLLLPGPGQPLPSDPAPTPDTAQTHAAPLVTIGTVAMPQTTQAPDRPATPMATAPRVLLMPQQATPMASAWFALLLETEAGEQRNALLALELGAPQTAALYGRDLFTPRSDPWLQQAVLLASGQVPRVTTRPREHTGSTCQTADCPYHGRAPCPQPFCPDALRIPALG